VSGVCASGACKAELLFGGTLGMSVRWLRVCMLCDVQVGQGLFLFGGTFGYESNLCVPFGVTMYYWEGQGAPPPRPGWEIGFVEKRNVGIGFRIFAQRPQRIKK